MRATVSLIIAVLLAGCTSRHNGRDGMDGLGVAAGLRQELQRSDR